MKTKFRRVNNFMSDCKGGLQEMSTDEDKVLERYTTSYQTVREDYKNTY